MLSLPWFVRIQQLCFSAATFGLAISLIEVYNFGDPYGKAPIPLIFTVVASSFGILITIVGFGSANNPDWLKIQVAAIIIDAVAAALYMAAGVILAYSTKSANNEIFTADGAPALSLDLYSGISYDWQNQQDWYVSRCQKAQTAEVFMFVNFAAYVVTFVMCVWETFFVRTRRGPVQAENSVSDSELTQVSHVEGDKV